MNEIQTVIISTGYARPELGDPGSVEIGHYFVSGRDLIMCDQSGKPMAKPHRLGPDDDPRVIAGRLTRARWLKSDGGSGFSRQIHYRPLGIA
jgi:hypothetical protein